MNVILSHVSNLCGGDAAKRDILTNWIADLLQYPQNKPGQVMALVSGPGTGTDALALLIARLISEENVFTTADVNEVIGPTRREGGKRSSHSSRGVCLVPVVN